MDRDPLALSRCRWRRGWGKGLQWEAVGVCVCGAGVGPWGSEGQACKTHLSLATGLHVAPGTEWPAGCCLATSHDGGTDFHPVQLGMLRNSLQGFWC